MNYFLFPKAEIINKDTNNTWYDCLMWNDKLLVKGTLYFTIINIKTFQIETNICNTIPD